MTTPNDQSTDFEPFRLFTADALPDNLDEQISQMSKSEISAFKEFESVYKVQHPLPSLPSISLGWESWATLATAGASVVLAAFRTAQAFYLAAVAKSNPFLSLAEASSAVLAIEGTVVLFALQRAREAKRVDARSSTIGLWVAFIISVLAGLYQSINIITLSQSGAASVALSWALALAMGLGATAIAWLSGDVLGVHLVRLEVSRREAREQHMRSVQAHRASMLREWKRSFEQSAVDAHKSSRLGVSRSSDTGERSRTPVRPEAVSHLPIPVNEVIEVFETTLSQTGGIAGVGETARILMQRRNPDKSDDGWENLKSRVSGIRKKWMQEKGIQQSEGS